MQLDRGHIQYVRDMQRCRYMIQLNGTYEVEAFNKIVEDALLDPEDRQPAFWRIDGAEADAGVIEYTRGDSAVRTTYQRYASRILGLSLLCSSSTVDNVCKKIAAIMEYNEADFRIISGYEIVEAYRDNIDGGNSCMREECSVYTNWYAENPDKVQMLVWKNKARALLWTCDDGTKVLDRIYRNAGAHVPAMILWANVNGYIHRGTQSAEFEGWRDADGLLVDAKELTVTMQKSQNKMYPWMDSFKHAYGDDDDDTFEITAYLRLDSDGRAYHDYLLQHQHGNAVVQTTSCRSCGVRLVDHLLVDGYCETCREEFVECGHCGHITDDDETYIVHTDSGDESWCYSCSHSSAVVMSCYHCGERASLDDTPDGWHGLAETSNMICPDCLEHYTCQRCGEVTDLTRLRVSRRTSHLLDQAMCFDCADELGEIAVAAISAELQTTQEEVI